MVGVPAARGRHRRCLRATAVTLGLLAGCASDRATPAPTTPLPSLAPIVVTVTATTTIATAVAPPPATAPALLTDVYGQPLDTGVTYTVPSPPTTAAPASASVATQDRAAAREERAADDRLPPQEASSPLQAVAAASPGSVAGGAALAHPLVGVSGTAPTRLTTTRRAPKGPSALPPRRPTVDAHGGGGEMDADAPERMHLWGRSPLLSTSSRHNGDGSALRHYVVRYRGRGPAPAADVARIAGAVRVLDHAGPHAPGRGHRGADGGSGRGAAALARDGGACLRPRPGLDRRLGSRARRRAHARPGSGIASLTASYEPRPSVARAHIGSPVGLEFDDRLRRGDVVSDIGSSHGSSTSDVSIGAAFLDWWLTSSSRGPVRRPWGPSHRSRTWCPRSIDRLDAAVLRRTVGAGA